MNNHKLTQVFILLIFSGCATTPPVSPPVSPSEEHEDAPRATIDPLPDPLPDPIPDPVPDPPSVSLSGNVSLSGRSFSDDDGPFAAWGVSLFWGLWGEREDPQYLDSVLDWLASWGVDYVRVLSMVGSQPYWAGRVIDPGWPGYDEMLVSFLERCARRGLRVQVVLFADAQEMMPDWRDRRLWVERVAGVLESTRSSVQFVEIANESNLNGVDDEELADLTTLWNDVSTIPVAPSSPDGGNAEISLNRLFSENVIDADLLTPHFDRRINTVESVYRPHRQPWEAQFYDRVLPFVSNEPIGPGSSGDSEADPARLAIGMAATFIAGGAGHVLHSSAGVRGHDLYWEVVSDEIMSALRAMRDLLPGDIANAERCNHHWSCHPYESDDQIWPDTGETGVVRAFAANLGEHSYVAIIGMRDSYTVTAKRAMGVEIFSARTGERIEVVELDAGQEWTFREHDGTRDFLHRITSR